jgi:protoporphyrin/coproporphyrin ferrochelatase
MAAEPARSPPVAVLLMAYGGPGNLDEVEPYLADVRGGRATSPELVQEIRHRYEVIGGRSPILEHTRAQAAALGRVMGPDYATYVGMRHWHPYIKETVDRIAADGRRRLIAVAMAPHYSSMSVGAYEKKVIEAAAGRVEVALVRSWGDHPQFLAAVREHAAQALQRFPVPAKVRVVFTAHSLPERILAAGDPYPDELKASARRVAESLRLGTWEFAFQSAGASPEPWLGPEAGAVLERLAGDGVRDFLIVPIGFVCDHVEILYDVDVEYQSLARKLGVRLERTASLNDDPLLIAALADVVHRVAAERGWENAA